MKNIWRQQYTDSEREYSKSEMMMLINNKMLSLEKEIKSRDRIEIIACIIVILGFGYRLFTSSSDLTQLGCIIIISAAGFIWYRLKSAQLGRIEESASYDRSMEQHLKEEREQVEQQRKLLKNVAWWYIGPMTVGLMLITIDADSGFWFRIGYATAVLIFGFVVWKFNKRAAKKKFKPLIEEINAAIEVVEDEQP